MMDKLKKIILLVPMILMGFIGFGFAASSIGYAAEPAEFRVDVVNGEATAKGYIGSTFDGNLVVPATVVSGGSEVPLVALSQSTNSTEFTRFMNNKNITSLDLSGATNLRTIGTKTFYKCTNLVGELHLPNSLTSIETRAFEDAGITKVYISRYITDDSGESLASDGYTNIASGTFSDDTTITFVFSSQEMLDHYKTCGVFAEKTCIMTVESVGGDEENSGGGEVVEPETPDEPEIPEEPEVPAVVEVELNFDLNYDATGTLASLVRGIGKTFKYEKSGEDWVENTSFTFPVAERTGCDFLGWSLTPNGDEVSEDMVIEESMVDNGSITLYALWQEKFYNITYHYSDKLTPSDTLPTTFGALTGMTLPSLVGDSLLIEWEGWYLDIGYVNAVENIAPGTAHDVQLWAKHVEYSPKLTLQSQMISGEDVDKIYFDDEVKYTANVVNYPNTCTIGYEWKLYDTSWVTIGTSSQCVVGSKLPKEYQLKCVVTLNKNRESVVLESVLSHNVEKWDINIDWKSTPDVSYTGYEYVHDFDINYSDDFIENACTYKCYVHNGEDFVECDEAINAGKYKIVVDILEAYKSIAKFASPNELEFTIKKRTITTTYDGEYHNKEYDGIVYTPNITLNNENWGDTFDLGKLTQSVYYKKGNTYHLFARHLLSESVDLEGLENASQYYFELSIDDENYELKSAYSKQILLVSQKKVNVVWTNVNLEYNGSVQVPTAQAKDIDGNDLEIVVGGGQVDANDGVNNLYTATATLTDSNYVLNNPACDFYISKASTFIVYSFGKTGISKLYDGKKFEITASVHDNYGKVADNVVIACDTDLTSVGTHRVVLSWSGDHNHFAPSDVICNLIVKMENIVFDDKTSGNIVVSSSEGFTSESEVVVENNGTELVNQSVYNSLNSAYDIHNIYRITNSKSKDLTIMLALPSGITSSKQLKVFEILENGEMQEVKYTISNGSIKLNLSSSQSTFAVVCVKDNTSVAIILGCIAGFVVSGVIVMLVVMKKRKNKTISQ